jgi:hypothetical protein
VPSVSKPITAQEALDILASALSYCQQAGLRVNAGNAEGQLVIAIDGARIDAEKEPARLLVVEAVAVPSKQVPPIAS